MIRTTLLATALMTATLALPAMAQDAAPADKPAQGQRWEARKAKMAEHHEAMKGKRAEHRAAMDAKRDACHERIQGADTPEKAKYIHEKCRAEGKAKHEAMKERRMEKREEWQGKRDEWKAKRAERKAAKPAAE